jgi:uncharacterized membrane protein HdeD (DUF308 family)
VLHHATISARLNRLETPAERHTETGGTLIVLGIILLIIAAVAAIHILWVIGGILLIVGLVLLALGATDRAIGGRRHYF